MSNELMRYARGQEPVPWHERRATKQAKEVLNEVRLADLEVQGAFALASKIMEKAVDLDSYRQSLSRGDTVVNMMLADIQIMAMRQAHSIQSNLYT